MSREDWGDQMAADGFDYDDRDDEPANSYTVCMKNTPPGHDVASVIWANTKAEALKKGASQWGCKPTDCFIYGDES